MVQLVATRPGADPHPPDGRGRYSSGTAPTLVSAFWSAKPTMYAPPSSFRHLKGALSHSASTEVSRSQSATERNKS